MERTELFVKVPSKRLYQRVAGQIQDLIIAGKLQVGDKLPAEAELCDQFGVSRTVIREATKSLAERGLLSSQPGRGTFLTALSPQTRFVRFLVKRWDRQIKRYSSRAQDE